MRMSEVPECEECYQENPKEYVEQELCPACPRKEDPQDPVLVRLVHFLGLQDSGCPIDRHELLDWEWQLLGHLKAERDKGIAEQVRKASNG